MVAEAGFEPSDLDLMRVAGTTRLPHSAILVAPDGRRNRISLRGVFSVLNYRAMVLAVGLEPTMGEPAWITAKCNSRYAMPARRGREPANRPHDCLPARLRPFPWWRRGGSNPVFLLARQA